MFDTLTSGISATKAAYDLLKTVQDAKPSTEVVRFTEELRSKLHVSLDHLIDAQERCLQLQEENRRLASEITQLKQHHIEREHYELHRYPLGSFVYRLKPEHRHKQHTPDLCTSCMDRGVKSYMQAVTDRRTKALKCHECKSLIETEHWPASEVDYNEELMRMAHSKTSAFI